MRKGLSFMVCGLVLITGLFVLQRQRVFAQSVGTTSLLYSFVTNQAGYDTELVITNASATPFGNDATAGTCIINYYGTAAGGVTLSQQTTTTIPAGSQIIFTLSGGGEGGVRPTPGFHGYMVAACNFPLAQGVEAIGDQSGKFLSYFPANVLPAF
jgi:hypothetical protein